MRAPYSVILVVGARYLVPLMLLLSMFLLLRGHYEPGGGFSGGLVASAAFIVYALANGVPSAREVLYVRPVALLGWGLLLAFSSGMLGMLTGQPFLTGLWLGFEVPGIGSVGTPLLFDVGVYMVVLGVVLMIIFALAEES